MKRRIDFFYVEAGGGHKSAAIALKAVIAEQRPDWEVRTININQILEPLDIVKKITGVGGDESYNRLLKSGWTILAPYLMPPMHALIWLYHSKQVKMLQEFWGSNPPDMAVSLIPHFNRALCEAFGKANPNGPFVTIMTDLADIPPRVWIERQKQWLICGSDKAVQQAYSFDHPKERVFQVSGMILRPSFYEVKPIDRVAERTALGLKPEVPTGLVLFGGEGSKMMTGIARDLGESGLNLQLILMHGKNEELGTKLKQLRLPIPVHVQGFTSEVPKFMQIADFMLGKPGPGSITEALAMKLPMIVDCNAWTLEQERYNAQWLLEKRLGMVVKSWKEAVPAVKAMLEPGVLEEYRSRAAGVKNNVVFEIPGILEKILEMGR